MDFVKFLQILECITNICLSPFDSERDENEKFRGPLIRQSALECDEKFAPRSSNVQLFGTRLNVGR